MADAAFLEPQGVTIVRTKPLRGSSGKVLVTAREVEEYVLQREITAKVTMRERRGWLPTSAGC